MRRAIVFVLVAACWRSSPPPTSPRVEGNVPAPAPPQRRTVSQVEEVFEHMERFTDDMCSCQDAACAQRVSDEMTRWSQEQAARQAEPPKLTEDDTKRAAAIGERMGHCLQNAMQGPAAGSATP